MDRIEQLRTYTTAELIGELRRRKDELDAGISMLAGSAGQAKNSRMSEAKAEYWRPWREYKAANPNATLAEWRRAQRRSTKK